MDLYQGEQMNEKQNILADALKFTQGDRQAAYGSPYENWKRTSDIAVAITGLDTLTPEMCVKVALAMKLARLRQTANHRDSMVDLAGYSWVLSEVMAETERLERLEDGWGHTHEDDTLQGILRELNGMIGDDKHEQLMGYLQSKMEEERRILVGLAGLRAGRVVSQEEAKRRLGAKLGIKQEQVMRGPDVFDGTGTHRSNTTCEQCGCDEDGL
jgi:hypothetical protein